MKRRFLLLMVSFFAMSTAFASLKEAYKMYFTAGSATAGTDVALTLNLKSKTNVSTYQAALTLPTGFTFKSVAADGTRYAEGATPTITATTNADGTVTIACEGAEISGTDGAVATVTVSIDRSVAEGQYAITLASQVIVDATSTIHNYTSTEYQLAVAAATGLPGDANLDGEVTSADIQAVLNIIAGETETNANADANQDGEVTSADIQAVLNIIAGN